MAYTPVQSQNISNSEHYIPSSNVSNTANSENTDSIVDKFLKSANKQSVKELEADVTPVANNLSPIPYATDSDWKWLNQEISNRLNTANPYDMSLSLEERSKIHLYRDSLRRIPSQIGSSWTRESIIWPDKP